MQRCPHCEAQLESPLGCSACGQLFDAPEDLTPFELFGLEPAYSVDQRALERRLRTAMRVVHPDHFANAAAELRERAERASARNNSAYRVLADAAARADWLIAWLGGPDENQERAMPQPFLLKVLEWSEQLQEARAGSREALEGLADLQSMLGERRAAALEALARLLTPLPARGAPALRAARTQLNVVRYLERALSEIEELHLRGPARA
jgi:molecular chaperone HscB